MTAESTGNVYSDLARLDDAAAEAGCALACRHESADDLHRDMIRRYFALHPRRSPFGLVLGAAAFIVFVILL
jgi:hypothetical protein